MAKNSPTGSLPMAKKSPTGSLPPAVPVAITPTFRPWTHTSDDSYFCQLSLVVATATVYFGVDVFCTYVCSSHITVLSTRRHPAHPVYALTLRPIEVQALWSQKYAAVSYVIPG